MIILEELEDISIYDILDEIIDMLDNEELLLQDQSTVIQKTSTSFTADKKIDDITYRLNVNLKENNNLQIIFKLSEKSEDTNNSFKEVDSVLIEGEDWEVCKDKVNEVITTYTDENTIVIPV